MGIKDLLLAIIVLTIVLFLLFSGGSNESLLLIPFALATIDAIRRKEIVRALIGIVVFFILIMLVYPPLSKLLENVLPAYSEITNFIILATLFSFALISVLSASNKGWLTSIGVAILCVIIIFQSLEIIQRIEFISEMSRLTRIPIEFIIYVLAILAFLVIIFIFPK
ncbi:MAG: hypothetical protein QXG91_03090 [Candidatus Aenigmatarchaeota archaeon]